MAQIFLGDRSWTSLVDGIVDGACAAAPGLEREPCRELVELILVVRVRETEACGRHPACRPDGAMGAPAGPTCGWQDPDPEALPAMFAAAAADLAGTVPAGRARVEVRLADGFRAALREGVFHNPRCGHAEVCRAEPTSPIGLRGRRG
jgi:hypothetical protein